MSTKEIVFPQALPKDVLSIDFETTFKATSGNTCVLTCNNFPNIAGTGKTPEEATHDLAFKIMAILQAYNEVKFLT